MFDLFQGNDKLVCLFSKRGDGSMKISGNSKGSAQAISNRAVFFRKNSINPFSVISAGIGHTPNVVIVSDGEVCKSNKDSDGLITKEKGLFLSITVADCLPVFFFDSKREIIGLFHAGWRGLLEDIMKNAVSGFITMGSDPKDIMVAIGPAICQNHYQVDPELRKIFCAKYDFSVNFFKENRNPGTFYFDLKGFAKERLMVLGIRKDNIEINPRCTFEEEMDYFSYRRDKPENIQAMIALFGIREELTTVCEND